MPIAHPVQPVPISNAPAMILGIIVAMFCGCIPGGLLAILFADQAKKAAARGDRSEAETKLRLSYLTSGISLCALFAGFCLYVGLMIAMNA